MFIKSKIHWSNFSLLYCSYFSVIFGEDVAFGGVFRCTVGLRDKYGKLTFKSDIIFILAFLLFCSPLWFVGEEKNMWERSLVNGLLFSFLSLKIEKILNELPFT